MLCLYNLKVVYNFCMLIIYFDKIFRNLGLVRFLDIGSIVVRFCDVRLNLLSNEKYIFKIFFNSKNIFKCFFIFLNFILLF